MHLGKKHCLKVSIIVMQKLITTLIVYSYFIYKNKYCIIICIYRNAKVSY